MLIITGASRGLGKYILEHYAETEEVIGTYLSTKPVDREELRCVDVTKEDDVAKLFSEIEPYATSLTVINCAGINVNGRVTKLDADAFRKVVDVTVAGSFMMTKYALPIMQTQGFGRIINIASVVPQIGVHGTSAYSASKSALWGLTKSVAKECAGVDITCNCLNLGYFDIGMIADVPEKMRASILSAIPKGRFGNPSNVINAIEFIRRSDYFTGSCIDLNGGLH